MYGLLSSSLNESFSSFIDNIKNIFTDFHWTDAVDIIILALLFYFVFFGRRMVTTQPPPGALPNSKVPP